jgi:hypothetical protein
MDRMSLGQVYDLDLRRNEGLIGEIVLQARGEVSRDLKTMLTTRWLWKNS